MFILYTSIALCLTLALYMPAAHLLKLPTVRQVKTIRDAVRIKTKTPSFVIWLSELIPIPDSRREELAYKLNLAAITVTPEEYVSECLYKSMIVLPIALIGCLMSPVVPMIMLSLGVYLFFGNMKKADEALKERKRLLEHELPQFVSYLSQNFRSGRDVLRAVSTYAASNESVLADELKLTVADMKTGNYELALKRLESRLSSPLLSDVTRGLVSALQGDDMAAYFNGLEVKFSDYQKQLLRRLAAKKPDKIGRMSMLVLLAMLFLVFTMLGMTVFHSVGQLF